MLKKAVYFSLIIPVYNRPDEVNELLESLSLTDYKQPFEVVIVEDGSDVPCRDVVDSYRLKLDISYYFKENTGPGDSRNYGMKRAKGDYFLIFDSDCIIPVHYLGEVERSLAANYCDCFGGPDKALGSFSDIQKAINFAMTSILTTGGIRGASEKIDKFQPRSFNMGLSRKAFEQSGGFGNIHPGEDPELTMRLWRMGYQTRLFSSAYVYHKRRIDWEKFSLQVNKFGKARPILDSWFPEYAKPTYWFPTLFVAGFYTSLVLLIFAQDFPLKLYFIYFFLVLILSTLSNRSLRIGFLSIIAVWRQFMGYGHGFAESFYKIKILKKQPEEAFPELFFIKSPSQSAGRTHTKIIGLTGGIGSGKSTVANLFRREGIPVYIADDEAKKILDRPEIAEKVADTFNLEIIEGKVDRKKLAAIVFDDPEKLAKLNGIIHPAVKADFSQWVAKNCSHEVVVKEAAILYESGTHVDCDAVIVVTAPIEERIARVMKRDRVTREAVLHRIENQWDESKKVAMADYVIENVTTEDAESQFYKILKKLKNV